MRQHGVVLWIAAALAPGAVQAQASFTAVAPPPGQASGVNFQAVSADGSVAAGFGNGPLQAFRWTAATGVVQLPFLVGVVSDAHNVSGDGTIIVGIGNRTGGFPPPRDEAVTWTGSGGAVGLGELPGGSFQSFANGVSGDGSIVVGESVITNT
jgi:uncharacterized membrane protein